LDWNYQARKQGEQGAYPHIKIFSPLEKCVGHSLKLLDIVKKFGPLSENSSTPGDPSWLRA